MSRRDEEVTPHNITFNVSAISNPGSGMSVSVERVWADVNGQKVTELIAGQAFRIMVKYTSAWPEGGVSFFNPWTVVFTAMEIKGEVYASGKTRTNESPHTETMIIPDPQYPGPKELIMPSYSAQFRIRPWGHPDWELISWPNVEDW